MSAEMNSEACTERASVSELPPALLLDPLASAAVSRRSASWSQKNRGARSKE